MSDENIVHLAKGSTNNYGATFWELKADTRYDGRGIGGLVVAVNIHAQIEGLCIAGNYISWEELHKAEAHARKHASEFAAELNKVKG